MAMNGGLTGTMIFAFDDACGLSLTDLLLNHPSGTAREWGEMECSAALESTNIIGCAYLNSLVRHLPYSMELVPSPPVFRRDFAESLLQAAFMDQAMAANFIFLARARFEIRGAPLNWSLLFIPDAPSLARLGQLFPKSG
jgi:chemotaxis protein CheC